VIDEATVKSHVARILLKLGLGDWVPAVVLPYERALLRSDTTRRPTRNRKAQSRADTVQGRRDQHTAAGGRPAGACDDRR
jgi:hypothetical protein